MGFLGRFKQPETPTDPTLIRAAGIGNEKMPVESADLERGSGIHSNGGNNENHKVITEQDEEQKAANAVIEKRLLWKLDTNLIPLITALCSSSRS
jgi:hypothetical protein